MRGVEPVLWNNRDAIRMSNGIVELISLCGGGHIAAFCLLGHPESPSVNALWKSSWETHEPGETSSEELASRYGGGEAAKFLASYTGHSLCLDYFGVPSAEMRAAGAGLHGEAGVLRWNWKDASDQESVLSRGSVRLPLAGLAFEREIRLGKGEPVAYLRETVTNMNDVVHAFDWVQHVTFGPPLLKRTESLLIVSADCGMTAPHGYEDREMLDFGRTFEWPCAPGAKGTAPVDLRRPFAEHGKGFLAGVRLNPLRETQFLLAVNMRLRMGVVYLFRRCDFPWMTIWEENCARENSPWNGRTEARGMEFGTCPLPLGRDETVRRGTIFDTPHQCVLSAGETKQSRYLIALFEISDNVSSVAGADAVEDRIVIRNEEGDSVVSIPAARCESYLSRQ
jgi:hypothetical protein